MGRWVTSKGRRIYIPDEGEKNPYAKEKSLSKSVNKKNVNKNSTNKKTPESVTDAKTHKDLVDKLDKSGLKLDSADAHSMQHASYFNDTKVTMYDNDGNEYQGTYNKYSDGGREIIYIKKTKDSAKKVANDNNNLKEKQIAENKKQVDKNTITVNGRKIKIKERENHAQAIYRNAMEEQNKKVDKEFYDSLVTDKEKKSVAPTKKSPKKVSTSAGTKKPKVGDKIRALNPDVKNTVSSFVVKEVADKGVWVTFKDKRQGKIQRFISWKDIR